MNSIQQFALASLYILFGTLAIAIAVILAVAVIAGICEAIRKLRRKADEESSMRAAYSIDDGTDTDGIKTHVSDCRRCWCDQCVNIENCGEHLPNAVPDGIRPMPCLDCTNGRRFMPQENEPLCGKFAKADGRNNY